MFAVPQTLALVSVPQQLFIHQNKKPTKTTKTTQNKKALCDLYALRVIESDMLFRNDEYVAPAKAKAIQKLILQLCSELRGVAVPLVNAWAIPDHILRAPIGLGAGSGASDMYKGYLAAAGFGESEVFG